jgi:hypothetical protein
VGGWDVLNNVISKFPPVAMTLLLAVALVAAIVFVAGFSRHGLDFVKYGFGQTGLSDLGAKIDGLQTEFRSVLEKMATKEDIGMINKDIGMINARIETIETNHFGHLKNFLTELTSILLDKGIINNENKARLDNQLRGM